MIPSRSASTVRIDSTAPTAPTEWPKRRLRRIHGRLVAAERPVDRHRFRYIADHGSGRVRVDVVDVAGRQTRELDRPGHRVPGLLAVGIRRHDVEPVRRDARSHQTAENVGPTCLRMVFGLDHHAARRPRRRRSRCDPCRMGDTHRPGRRWWWTTRFASGRTQRSARPQFLSRRRRRSRCRPRQARWCATHWQWLRSPRRMPRSPS